MKFSFAGDEAANLEVARRIAKRARRRDVIPYAELVQGITFRLPNVGGGMPLQLGELGEWTELDRAILGSVLGRISADSYLRAGFLASAIAVSRSTWEPSEGFKQLVKNSGLLRRTDGTEFLLFWSNQVELAHTWFTENPGAYDSRPVDF